MSDFLSDCNSGDLRIDPKTFTETWCARCSRSECSLAGFAKDDLMAVRNATWRERFFGDNQADLSIPKFARIAAQHFKDVTDKARRREVSARRGDWSVPEIDITDGQIIQAPEASTYQVDEAARQLRGSSPDDPLDLASEEDLDDEPEEAPEEEPPLASPAPRPRGNTPDRGEVMVGGGPAPASLAKVDPWAPSPKPKHTVIEVGATVTFGGERQKTDD